MIEVCKLIDEMAKRISMGEPKRISKRITLYSHGVKAKIEHAHYALLKIQEFNSQTDALSTNQKNTGDGFLYHDTTISKIIKKVENEEGKLIIQGLAQLDCYYSKPL